MKVNSLDSSQAMTQARDISRYSTIHKPSSTLNKANTDGSQGRLATPSSNHSDAAMCGVLLFITNDIYVGFVFDDWVSYK